MTEYKVSTRAGVGINVRDLGSGPAVLLIHGWSLSAEVWDRQIRVLAEAGHRVLAMDLRGHGRSDAPLSGYGIEELAGDAADVLASRQVTRAAVVGWSLGGMVALRLAHDHPTVVTSLTLVASNGVSASRTAGFPFGVAAEGPLHAILQAEHDDRIALRRKAVGDPFKSPPPPAVLDWLHGISLRSPSWAARGAMRTLLCTDQTPLLRGWRIPVTQLVGTADPALSLRGARWLAEQLGSVLIEFDAGHYPMLECPDSFDTALLTAVAAQRNPVVT